MIFFAGTGLLMSLSAFCMVQPMSWQAPAAAAVGSVLGWALSRRTLIALPTACAVFCGAVFFRQWLAGVLRASLLAAAAGQEAGMPGMLLWLAAEQTLMMLWLLRGSFGFGAAMLALLPWMLASQGERILLPALFLYQLSLALLLLTSALRADNPRRALRLAALLALPLSVICALSTALLRLCPDGEGLRREIRQGAELTAARTVQRLTRAGVPMRPQEAVQLRQEPPAQTGAAMIFELTARKGGIYYLRGQDYDTYTGMDWQTDQGRWEDFGGWGEPEDTVTISIADYSGLMLLPYYPDPGTMLHGGCFASTLRDYSFRIYPRGSAVSPQHLAPYCRLPESTRVWAAAFLSGRKTPAQIAALVESCALYDRQTPAMPEEEEDFAQWFALHSGRGYCMHFASLAVVLLRAAGFPARYVTGFRVEAPAGKAVAVTGEAAHAWAEFYDGTQGCWRILETTPAAGQAPAEPQRVQSLHFGSLMKIIGEGAKFLPIIAVFVVYLQSRLRLYLRHRRCVRGGLDSRVRSLHCEAVLLSGLLGEEPPRELELLYQRSLYSRHPPEEPELENYHAYFVRSRQQLRRRPWLLRLYHRLRWAAY